MEEIATVFIPETDRAAQAVIWDSRVFKRSRWHTYFEVLAVVGYTAEELAKQTTSPEDR